MLSREELKFIVQVDSRPPLSMPGSYKADEKAMLVVGHLFSLSYWDFQSHQLLAMTSLDLLLCNASLQRL